MTELARLKFYATQPHSCSYLPEEQATTLFLDPSQPMDVHVYADLSEMGFRRSGDHLHSLGAHAISRADFAGYLARHLDQPNSATWVA